MSKTLRVLVEVAEVEVDGRTFHVEYYKNSKINGEDRFEAEIQISSGDKITLGDDLLEEVKAKVQAQLPGAVHSRDLHSTKAK